MKYCKNYINQKSAALENKKKLRFWRKTICEDSPRDWTYILWILRRKLEFNIRYFKESQVADTWERDVREMETACHLIDIITIYNHRFEGTYINGRNAARFGIRFVDLDEWIKEDDEDNLKYPELADNRPEEVRKKDYRQNELDELRKRKAFRLLWSYIGRHIRGWWD